MQGRSILSDLQCILHIVPILALIICNSSQWNPPSSPQTGPKGVLTDYYRTQQSERRKEILAKNKRQEIIEKHSATVMSHVSVGRSCNVYIVYNNNVRDNFISGPTRMLCIHVSCIVYRSSLFCLFTSSVYCHPQLCGLTTDVHTKPFTFYNFIVVFMSISLPTCLSLYTSTTPHTHPHPHPHPHTVWGDCPETGREWRESHD